MTGGGVRLRGGDGLRVGRCVARVYERDGRLVDSLDIRVPDFVALDEQK